LTTAAHATAIITTAFDCYLTGQVFSSYSKLQAHNTELWKLFQQDVLQVEG